MDSKLMTEEILAIHDDCMAQPFEARTVYRAQIDTLVINCSPELSYKRVINRVLNVLILDDSGRVAGVEIKGFSRLLDNMKKFKAYRVVQDHPTLGLFLSIALPAFDGDGISDAEMEDLQIYLEMKIPDELIQEANAEFCAG